MSVLSSLSRASDTYSALRLLRLITTPWKKMNAYKHGIIDDNGKRNKDTVITQDIKQYYTLFHRLAFNLKRLIEKVPVIGRMTVTSYAAALLLLKEAVDYKGTDIEFIVEMFGDEKEILLDELNEMMTESLLSEGDDSSFFYDDVLNEGDRLVFPLVEKSGTDELSVVSTRGSSSFMGIPMIKVLYEEEDGGQTVTASIAPIIDRPLFSKTDSSVMRRRISIFDLDPEEYEHYTIRHHGDKWNEKYRHNEKLKRAWRREDLVFLRNKGTGTICSIGRAGKSRQQQRPVSEEEQTNEMKTNNKYSLNEIKELLSYQKPLNEADDDVLIESILEENDSLIRALDELHAFIEENDDNDDADERLESIVREIAEKYGVDEKVLDEMFFEELSIEDGNFILDESNELQKMRDLFNNYRKALEVMHKIVMDNLNDQGKPNKTLDFFAQKADNQIKGKYDPKKLASLYKEKYIDKGTGRVKKTPLSEGTLSDKEFDELMSQVMSGRLGDDVIDAMEEGDRKSMHRIIDAVINDDKKSKQIVDRILKSQK